MPSKDQTTDIRLAERQLRRQGAVQGGAPDRSGLADLTGQLEVPTQEDLDKLRADLISEGEARNRRIERFVREGPLKPVPRVVVPVSENDL